MHDISGATLTELDPLSSKVSLAMSRLRRACSSKSGQELFLKCLTRRLAAASVS